MSYAVYEGESRRSPVYESKEKALRVRDNYEETTGATSYFEVRAYDQSRDAMEAARHHLVSLHGLYAFDGEAPDETWQLDTTRAIGLLDEALGKGEK